MIRTPRSLELRNKATIHTTAEMKAAATRFTGDVSEATQQQQQRKSPEVSLPVQSPPPPLRSMTKSPVNVHNYCVVDHHHAISSSSSGGNSNSASDWQRVLRERVLTKEAEKELVEKEKAAFEGLGHRQYYYYPQNGVGEGGSDDHEECLIKCSDRNAAVESQLEAILCNDSVENNNYYHKCRRRVSCDCEVCLSRELVRVKREILLMIRQQETQVTDRQEEVAVGHVPSTAAAAPVVVDGSAKWNYLYVRKSPGGVVVGDSGGAEEEFEDEHGVGCCGSDLGPFVMVTGGGCGSGGGAGGLTGNGSTGFGAFLDMSSNNSHSITEKTATTTVEGQLNALLTSSAQAAEEKDEGGGGRRSASANTVKRHTNLIENQLLTLEEQFWQRTKGSVVREAAAPQSKEASSSVIVGGLEANEATALLSDLSQQTAMSDSTPVKRAAIKVTLAGSGSPMVALDDAQRVQSLQAAAAAATASNFGRMKRFEQFLKSLVGKKASSLPPHPQPHAALDGLSSKEQQQQDPLSSSGPVTFEQPALKVRSSVELKSHGNRLSVRGGNDDDGPPLRHSFGSMSSLNSAVQQKFLNILPISAASSLTATKRNLSVNNLSTIPERMRGQGRKATITCHRINGRTATTMTTGSAARGLKTVSCINFENLNEVGARGRLDRLPVTLNKCSGEETVLRRGGTESCTARRLQMSKSANHLQSMMGGPVRPLNRFRNSMLEPSVSQVNIEEEEQSHQQEQCSRCSSILSLAGGTMGKVRCSDSSVESSAEGVDGGVAGHVLPEVRRPGVIVVTTTTTTSATRKEEEISPGVVQSCKLCLEVSPQQMTGIGQCQCTFCTDVSGEISRELRRG